MIKLTLYLLLTFFYLNLSANSFEKKFFYGKWVEQVGYKAYNFNTDTFNVLDYGAKNKGIFLTTSEIQKTIDACSSNGGGVVYVPQGKYHIGSIFIKDNVHLHFADSAVLLAGMSLNDYTEHQTRVAGIEMKWPVALINVRDAKNIKISGNAIINGRGITFWEKFHSMKPVYVQNNLRWALDYDCKRPRLMLIENASNVLIEDVLFKESAFWTVHVLYSNNVTIDGITIRNNIEGKHGPSTDGIDIDSSKDILVQNCDIDCNDDNICLKSGRDADGLRVNRPCEYVVIKNNKTGKGAGIVTFGSETSGGIHHIYVSGMSGNGTTRGIRFKSARTRGGVIENILIENVKIKNSPFIFEFTMNWNPKYSYTHLPDEFANYDIPEHWKTLLIRVTPPEKGICKLRNVKIKDVQVSGKCWKAFRVEGFREAPIENFVFEDIDLNTETLGEIKNAKNWRVINSSFNIDDNEAAEMTDCENMDVIFSKLKDE
jgi:polygalacturonase